MKYFYRFALMGALSCLVSFAGGMDQTIDDFRIKSYRAAELTDELQEQAKNVLLDFHESYYTPGTLNGMLVQEYRGFIEGKIAPFFQSINKGTGTFFAMTAAQTGVLHGVGAYYFDSDYGDVLRLSPIGMAFQKDSHASLMNVMATAFFFAFPTVKRLIVRGRPDALNKQGLIASAGFKESDYRNDEWSERGRYHFYEYERNGVELG